MYTKPCINEYSANLSGISDFLLPIIGLSLDCDPAAKRYFEPPRKCMVLVSEVEATTTAMHLLCDGSWILIGENWSCAIRKGSALWGLQSVSSDYDDVLVIYCSSVASDVFMFWGEIGTEGYH